VSAEANTQVEGTKQSRKQIAIQRNHLDKNQIQRRAFFFLTCLLFLSGSRRSARDDGAVTLLLQPTRVDFLFWYWFIDNEMKAEDAKQLTRLRRARRSLSVGGSLRVSAEANAQVEGTKQATRLRHCEAPSQSAACVIASKAKQSRKQ
jgi:hypothetical protein